MRGFVPGRASSTRGEGSALRRDAARRSSSWQKRKEWFACESVATRDSAMELFFSMKTRRRVRVASAASTCATRLVADALTSCSTRGRGGVHRGQPAGSKQTNARARARARAARLLDEQHVDRARHRQLARGEEAEQRRLARAVRPEQPVPVRDACA